MNNIAAIETQIVNVLSTVPEFRNVYSYEPLELADLPAATIFYSGWNMTDVSMPNTQEISENWILRIYVHLDDAKKAQAKIKAIVPKVREAFRENRSLSGTCLYCLLNKGNVFAVLDKNQAQLVCEITLSAIIEEYY